MPKQKADIPNFGSGLFLSHRDPEVPDNAITGDSLNVDITKNGHIRMARASKAVPADPAFSEMISWLWRFKLEAQSKLLIYGTGDDKGFHLYDDEPSDATTVEGEKIPDSDGHEVDQTKITASASNLALHLGAGSEPHTFPLWIGKYRHRQFAQDPPEGYHIERAELQPPASENFELMHKVVESDTRFIGIRLNGTQLHAFDDEGYLESSDSQPGGLSAICNDPINPEFVWVFDDATNEVHRFNELTLEKVSTITLSSSITYGSVQVTDMVIQNDRIWMALSGTSAGAGDLQRDKFLYSVEYTLLSENKAISNHSFDLIFSDDINIGNTDGFHKWSKRFIYDFYNPDHETVWEERTEVEHDGWLQFIIPPLCLTAAPSNNVAIFITPYMNGEYKLTWDNDGTPTTRVWGGVGMLGFFVGDDETRAAGHFAMICSENNSHRATPGDAATAIKNDHVVALNAAVLDWPEHEFNALAPTTAYSSRDITTIQRLGSNLFTGIKQFTDDAKVLRHLHADLVSGTNMQRADIQDEYFLIDYRDSGMWRFHVVDANDVLLWSNENAIEMATGQRDGTSSNLINITTLEEPIPLIELDEIGDGWTNTEDATFHFYRASLLYDGIQESPLSMPTNIEITENDKGVSVTVLLPKTLSRRITHLNIYRAHSLNNVAEQGFYRLVAQIDLSQEFPDSGVFWQIVHNDRRSPALLGPSYESSSGLPENLRNTLPHYGLSAMLNDRLYIADCWHPDIEDAGLFLFRSNRYAVDVFNWPENTMRLPATPVALAQMNGRIFVFDRSDCHIVNPESMYVEQTIQGAGAINRNSVVMTPDGIFVAGHYHAYQFTGSGRNVISRPVEIRDTDGIPWSQLANGNNFHALYHEQKREIIFLSSRGAPHNDARALSFNIPDQYWKAFRWATTNITAAGSTYHGEVVIADQDVMKWLFAGTGGLVANTTIRTKTFDFQDGNNNKWIYGLKIEATTENFNVTMQNQNSGHIFNMTKQNLGHGFFFLPIPANERKVRTIRFFINFDEDVKIHKVSIAYRRKVVYAGEDV